MGRDNRMNTQKIGRISTKNAIYRIKHAEQNYRKIGNPKNKEIAEGLCRNFVNAIILSNQTNGKKYYNIYIPC